MTKEEFCKMVHEVADEISEEKGITLKVESNEYAISVGKKGGAMATEFEFREMEPGVFMTPAQVEESIGYIV